MDERLHHVGLVVADLERSLGFYRDRIGLELLAQGAESDARYAEMLGVPRVRFAWAELDLGGGHVLELLRFDEPSHESAAGPSGGALRAGSATNLAGLPGVAHVGIRVDDIDTVHDALVKDGATVISQPIELVEDNQWLGVRVFYALDPDRHLVELIQEAPAAESDGR
jgi:catechol 2,3-dioxygenase-like lactoylglutathione lyase family enzyme